MFIVYDLGENVIAVCSSEKTLYNLVKDLSDNSYRVSRWDCPEDISDYLSRA